MKHAALYYMFTTGYFYKIVGKEKIPQDRKYLIVSNHRDGNDPIIYIAGMPKERVGWICKKEVMDIPCVGKLLLNLCSLPLERDNLRQEVRIIKKAQDYILDDICSVGIYPEGTRNKTENELLPFKAGAFKVATTTKCPIVVSCITYNYPRIHKHKPLIKIATINILKVIEPEEYENKDTNDLANMVREEILEFLNKENA
jgi:1-acyl-sn-glycerol-3-phosphate acyltransferase